MKTTKVYHAPGYPIDPAKEAKRLMENLGDSKCARPEPKLMPHQIEDLMYGRWTMKNFGVPTE